MSVAIVLSRGQFVENPKNHRGYSDEIKTICLKRTYLFRLDSSPNSATPKVGSINGETLADDLSILTFDPLEQSTRQAIIDSFITFEEFQAGNF